MGIDMYGCNPCGCPRCVANREVIQAAEKVVRQRRYGIFPPDLKELEKAVIKNWNTQREARAGEPAK